MNLQDVLATINDFCGTENVCLMTIGAYAKFITSMQEIYRYNGHRVCTDVYYKKDTNQFLIVRECATDGVLFSARIVNYDDMFKAEPYTSYKGISSIYDNSKYIIKIDANLVKRVSNVLEGMTGRNKYEGVYCFN